jgi:hypothetical protein
MMDVTRRTFMRSVAAAAGLGMMSFGEVLSESPEVVVTPESLSGGRTVALKLYHRAVPDFGIVGAWSDVSLDPLIFDLSNPSLVQSVGEIPASILDVEEDGAIQFLLARDAESPDDTLNEDWYMKALVISSESEGRNHATYLAADQFESPAEPMAPCVEMSHLQKYRAFDDSREESIGFWSQVSASRESRRYLSLVSAPYSVVRAFQES